jgi:hypothetical protein
MQARPRVYDFCGLPVASELALPQLRRSSALPEVSVSLGRDAAPVDHARWFHQWRERGGRLWLSIGRVDAGYLLRFVGVADFFVSADASSIVVRPEPDLPLETLHHLLIDQVLPLAASRRGRLSLHASAVFLPGIGTVGFAGETGRGKSTLAAAFAARGARIVADDCLAIDLDAPGVTVIPSYPGLRLFPGPAARAMLRERRGSPVAHYSTKQRIDRGAATFHRARSRLRALFLLSPRAGDGPAASVRRCRASAGLIGLVRYAYVLDIENRGDLAGLFSGLSRLATTVPVMHLRLRHGHGRLAAAAALIEQFAARA